MKKPLASAAKIANKGNIIVLSGDDSESYIFNKAGIRVSYEFPIFIIMSPIIKQGRRNKWDRESIYPPTPRIKRKKCSIKRPCTTDFQTVRGLCYL